MIVFKEDLSHERDGAKEKIKDAGFLQVEFALKLGMQATKLSLIVQGWYDPPLQLKKRIAEELGCSVAEIFP